MNIKEILSVTDHTLLKQDSTWEEIKKICDEAEEFNTASVCIPPSFVEDAKKYKDNIKICTVIGFPNGYSTTEVKLFETENALSNGADEIDMVINIGWLKDNKLKNIENEISTVKKICGNKILKVIIETCLLTENEKIEMCRCITDSGADYIKTSTGFSSGGALFDDIVLFKKYVGDNVKIKAAGGISSINDAEKFINLGADRLGTSRMINIVKKEIEKPI